MLGWGSGEVNRLLQVNVFGSLRTPGGVFAGKRTGAIKEPFFEMKRATQLI